MNMLNSQGRTNLEFSHREYYEKYEKYGEHDQHSFIYLSVLSIPILQEKNY